MIAWLTRRRPLPERLVTIGLTLVAIGVVDIALILLIAPAADSGVRAGSVPAIIVGAITAVTGLGAKRWSKAMHPDG